MIVLYLYKMVFWVRLVPQSAVGTLYGQRGRLVAEPKQVELAIFSAFFKL